MVADFTLPRAPRRLIGLAALLLLALLASTVAHGRILLKSSRKVVQDGEQFSFTVESNSRKEFNQITTIPGLEKFEVLSKSSSSRMQVVNGRFNSVLSRTFILRAKKPGRYTLGPIKVRVGRKTVTSRPLKVAVKKVVVDPSKPRRFFLKANIEPASGYVNQQLIYVLKVYYLDTFYKPRLVAPSFKDFWQEGEEVSREYIERVGEVSYKVTEVRVALFPQKIGQLTLQPATFAIDVPLSPTAGRPFDPFMSAPTRRVTLKSNPVPLIVKAIPNVGLSNPYVGRLSVKASPLPDKAKVGDSISIKVQVSGTGNVRDLKAPELNIKGARVYADKPEQSFDQSRKGLVTGTRTFTLAVVPEQPGPLKIPALTFSALDPATGKLRQVSTPAKTIAVSGAPAHAAASTGGPAPSDTAKAVAKTPPAQKAAAKTPVTVLGSDISTEPLAGAKALRPLAFGRFFSLAPSALIFWGMWAILAIIALVLLAELLLPGLRQRRHLNRQRRRALPSALKQLAASDAPSSSAVVREYLSVKLQRSFAAATAADMVSAVASLKSVPAAVVESLRRCLELSDAARYSPMGTYSANERSEAGALLKQLDRAIR